MWRVLFETGEAIHLAADDADSASLLARLQAWSLTGLWMTVAEVSRA
jgi:hypothetical protein